MTEERGAPRAASKWPWLAAVVTGIIALGVVLPRFANPPGSAGDTAAVRGSAPVASSGPSSTPAGTPPEGAATGSAAGGAACAMAKASMAPVDMSAGRGGQVVVVLGDSYSSGWRGVGEGADGWPAILGANRHWEVHNLAAPGTGFLNPGFTHPSGSQAPAAIALHPGVVFVVGGHNDEELPSGRVARAADRLLEALAAGLPDAVLVVVGPIWPAGDRYGAALVPLRDHLRARAAAIGALFIDPIADRWLLGANARLVGADGTHPTADGYRRFAQWIAADLQADRRLAAPSPVGPANASASDRTTLGTRRAGGGSTCAS